MIPQPYNSIVNENYQIIEEKGIIDDSLTRYFDGSFKDVGRMVGLYKTWICVKCLAEGKYSYGWGDKPKSKKCSICGSLVYEVGTFQARGVYVGTMFEYACLHLLIKRFNIDAKPTAVATRLYDFEVKDDLVIEAKGSPEYIINPDGTKSKLGRPGMLRSDTKKKAFANASQWRQRFPNGKFYILTNAIPNDLKAYRDSNVTAIYDVTKASQLLKFTNELPKS